MATASTAFQRRVFSSFVADIFGDLVRRVACRFGAPRVGTRLFSRGRESKPLSRGALRPSDFLCVGGCSVRCIFWFLAGCCLGSVEWSGVECWQHCCKSRSVTFFFFWFFRQPKYLRYGLFHDFVSHILQEHI